MDEYVFKNEGPLVGL